MKTPEEIKRGLEHCASYNPCIQCDYDARDWPRCVTRLHGDAIAYIQQLEQDNARKDERIRQLEREKADLLYMCEQACRCLLCKHIAKGTKDYPCCDCRYCEEDLTDSYWEWSGLEEE